MPLAYVWRRPVQALHETLSYRTDMTQLLVSPLAGLRTLELGPGSEPLLQRFFEANPLYFLSVSGEPPGPEEAFDEIHEDLPEGWPFTKKWVIGFADASGELAAMANVVSDMLAQGVWHISTFIVETARHGTGDAAALYAGIETWARANGAQWLRLGVVKGNVAAERFWQKCAFQQTRERPGILFGQRKQTVRVMCKPLSGRPMLEYLDLIARDRPEPETA
jgi:GNAT superfamily N-acetyltransferase